MIEHDAAKLAARIQQDFGSAKNPANWIWNQSSSAKVLDCVLSLRKRYRSVVEPRVKGFVEKHPQVASCGDLRALIESHASPEVFVAEELDMRSPKKAAIIIAVLDHLIDIQRRFEGASEDERLTAWARWCRPGDFSALDIPHFGLAGFQYLRMLFGADTVKPDVHIIRYVESAIDRKTSDIRAVYLVERAGEMLNQPVRHVDVAIWSERAGQASSP